MGGGLIWRATDDRNYYLARTNPLEQNIRVYRVVNGIRHLFQNFNQTMDAAHWHILRSKLDVDFVHVELTNAESALVSARNGLKASFAELNRTMGIAGPEDYILEDIATDVHPLPARETLIERSRLLPELKKAEEQRRSAEAKLTASKRQYFPTINTIARRASLKCSIRTGVNARVGGGPRAQCSHCRCLRGF